MGYSSVFLHNSLDMWRRQRAASKHCTLPTHKHAHTHTHTRTHTHSRTHTRAHTIERRVEFKNLEEVGQRKKTSEMLQLEVGVSLTDVCSSFSLTVRYDHSTRTFTPGYMPRLNF